MVLQLIAGGSGSGKTTYLYEQLIKESMENPKRQYFLLVPEQFTMQTQKDIVTLHPRHGTMNIDIVSFQRLAYRVFEELAVENLQVLDDMGKSMVIRKVAAQLKTELPLLQGHLGKTGFINQLKSMLSEFYQYGITPDMLKEMAPLAKTALLRQKLLDFSLIFQGFQDYISGLYVTAEEVLEALCRLIPQSELIRGSVMAFDGFTGFTPVQYRVMELLLLHSKKIFVTVWADPSISVYQSMGIQNLFHMSSQMVRRLSDLADRHQVDHLPDIWLGKETSPRFPQKGELHFLEQNLFRYGRQVYGEESTGAIRLYQGKNPSEEISYVVHQIAKFVREEGLRYREIGVITGDLAGYGKEIAHQFEKNGLPYFMDDKKSVLDNPMVELIRAAIEVVRKDFSYESIFRYLRTGLAVSDQTMADRMENYVLALGIRGYKQWSQSWERTYRGGAYLNLEALNAFRIQILEPLIPFRLALKKKDGSLSELAGGIRGLLQACRIEEKMQAYTRYFTELGEFWRAKEYEQIFGMVEDLLTRLCELLGEQKADQKEFAEILDAGFEEMNVGIIPATVDRIVVGDLTRTRLAHIKVLFFVGVNDGIVPAKKDSGSLLTDQEREFFGSHQIELAATAREESFQQRFYLYLMMTKPSQKLMLSYANVGSDGKSRRISYLVGELKKLFPAIGIREESPESSRSIYSLQEAKSQLIAGLRGWGEQMLSQWDEEFLELCSWFFRNETVRKEAFSLVEGAFYVYESHGIGKAAAQALYGTTLSGSVTRLEQFAACAYRHFLTYGLELCERQRYELDAADFGNLFHDAIDRCFQTAQEEGLDWNTISDQTRDQMVHRCVEAVTSEYGNTILASSARNAYLAKRVEHMTRRTIWALQQQIKKGDFVPSGFEVSFSAADNLKALNIPLSQEETLHLRGRIDRLDLCREEDRIYVKVIDYKSGSASFDLAAVYYGLQLQLVVYLDAVMEITQNRQPQAQVIPAGILYYHIQDPVIAKGTVSSPEEIQGEILRKLRMDGLVNSELEVICHMDRTIEKESDVLPVVLKDQQVQEAKSSVANRERFAALQDFVRGKLKEAGQEILGGNIQVAPYKSGERTACDYCPYHPVCGFDKKTGGYEYRKLRKKKCEEIWEELCR